MPGEDGPERKRLRADLNEAVGLLRPLAVLAKEHCCDDLPAETAITRIVVRAGDLERARAFLARMTSKGVSDE